MFFVSVIYIESPQSKHTMWLKQNGSCPKNKLAVKSATEVLITNFTIFDNKILWSLLVDD